MNLVKVISTSISKKIRSIKILRFGKDDVRTPDEAGAYGVDSNPIKDMRAIYMQGTDDENDVIIGYINKNQKALPGEIRLFSTNAQGDEKFYIWLRDNGFLELGGTSNFAVKFNELKTEFNALKKSHNDFLTEYKTHTHILSVPAITTAPPVSTQLPNTSNIDNAKNDKIKTIG